jgi:hypothetical protein
MNLLPGEPVRRSGALCASCGLRQPVGGLRVCPDCERGIREALRAFPGLYAALLIPTRPGGRSPIRLRGHAPPLPIQDRPRQERAAIRACLVSWCLLLAEDFGCTLPADGVEVMVHHVAVQAGRLLASDHAERLHHDVTTAARHARRCAYPSRPERLAIGRCPAQLDDGSTCGATVRARPEDENVTCPGCGDAGVLSWWHTRLVPSVDGSPLATGADLAAWLSVQTGRVVTEQAVRHWAHKGHITRHGKDLRGRTLYSVAQAREHAIAS